MKIKEWLNHHGMVIGITVVVVLIFIYIVDTMMTELKNHPETKEIGGPPVVTNLLAATIVVIALVVIVEYLKRCGDKNNL